jgi:KDO2-lipid IV(A) lauroyltransferase
VVPASSTDAVDATPGDRSGVAVRAPAAVRLLVALPLRPLHAIGAVLGCLAYALAPRYRRYLRANLQLALPRASLRDRLAATTATGRGAVEGLRVLTRPIPETALLVRDAVGWDSVEAARDAGHGILLISPHLGCFEILGPFNHPRPLTALYRPNRNAALQSLIEQGRGRYARLAPVARSGVRAVLAALKRGEVVLILPDQVPAAGEGVWEPFFGRPAYTMTLAARLTEVPEVRTFMFFGERLPRGAGFRLHFFEPDPPLAGDTRARVAAINRNVERIVLRHPEQYLWAYNRYKVPRGVEPCRETERAVE